METPIKVSVIVPCYKYGKYLEECIDSIVRQTYQPHEIIIVNDGSPDDTSQIARHLITKYPDSNIKLVEKENGGLSSCRNAGIKIATGNYIQCIDADDKMTPGAIEEHVSLIENDKTFVQCALMEFEERHTIMIPVEKQGLEATLQRNSIICNAMYPRKAWEEVGGYDESETMRLGYEDWEFWIRVINAGYYVNTSNFIALRYRCHFGQMTQATAHPNAQKLYRYIMDKHQDLYDKYNLKVAGLIDN